MIPTDGCPPFSGVLLAAGHSTRMGREKATLLVENIPLWQRQRATLAAAGAAEIFLSARVEQLWVREAKGFAAVLHDALTRCGPLVGITAALERASHPWTAVLAIDLPAMTPEWFDELQKSVRPGCGVVGKRGRYYEPLAAIYPREIRWLAWEALARGDPSLQGLIQTAVAEGLMRAHEIKDDRAGMFANWNSESDRRDTAGRAAE